MPSHSGPDRRAAGSVVGVCLGALLAAAGPLFAQPSQATSLTPALIDHAIRAIPPIERALRQTEARLSGQRGNLVKAERGFGAAKGALEAAVQRQDSIKKAYWLGRIGDLTIGPGYTEADAARISQLLERLAADFTLDASELEQLVRSWNLLRDLIGAVAELERHRRGLAATRDLLLRLRREPTVAEKLLAVVEKRDAVLLESLLGTGTVRIDETLLAARSLKLVFSVGTLRQCFAVTPLCDGNLSYAIQ